MSPTVEERLARAAHTLDRATAARLVRMDRSDHLVSDRHRTPARWITGVAAASVVLVLVAVAALVVRGAASDSAPAGPSHRVVAAVESTRSVAAMAVDLHGGFDDVPGGEAIWNYGAPDRWEHLSGVDGPRLERSPPVGATIRLHVGDRTWAAVEGRWSEEDPPHPVRPTPLMLLDRIGATDCEAEWKGQLIAWAGDAAPCAHDGAGVPGDLPDELPDGTEVWALELDDSGRLREVRAGRVAHLGDDVALDGQQDPLARVGALPGGVARFWYENVPEVSGEPVE